MFDPFAKVAIGDPVRFSAQWYNAVTDAGKAYQQKGAFGASSLSQVRDSTIIRVRNDSGSSLPRNSVVGLNGPIFTPTESEDAFLREVTFSVHVPDIAKHRRRFAVLLEPSPTDTEAYYGDSFGRVTRAYLAGLCAVKVEIMDEDHEYANIVDGVTDHLKSSRHGHARILWAEWQDSMSGYGYADSVQWCIVMMGATGSSVAVGKANGDIPARVGSTYGEGQVDIYRSSTGAYSGATEDGPIETIQVLNAAADVGSNLGKILSGKYCSLAWDADDVAWVAPLECNS